MWLAALAAGCVATPTIESVEFQLDDSWADGSAIRPGAVTRIKEVAVVDDQGNRTVLSGAGSYQVDVVGGTWDSATGEVTFSADEGTVTASGYSIAVVPASDVDIRAVKRFQPDWALINGPAPADLASFDVMLVWQDDDGADCQITEDTPLIPGAEYRLLITARDDAGRHFSSAPGALPIPPERVSIESTLFVAQEANPWQLRALKSESETAEFRIEANYGGDDQLTRVLTFPYDQEVATGPHPRNVVSVNEVVGQI